MRWPVFLLLLGAMTACRSPEPADRPHAAPSVAEPSAAEPIVAPVTPIDSPTCENVRFPSAGASVLVIPAATMTRALAPVVHAVCACTRSGDRVRVTAVMTPEAGTVTAIVEEDAAIDACVRREIDGGFPPFEVGSDCIDCGPKPARPPRTRVTYPFTLVHP